MAKRHHDKMHHSKHKMHGHYEGHEGRRHQEMKDAGMIHEDHSAIANMPQGVIMRDWPKGGHGMREGLNDTISGIDRQMDEDDSKRNKHERPHKY
jgi:hypothetical protein